MLLRLVMVVVRNKGATLAGTEEEDALEAKLRLPPKNSAALYCVLKTCTTLVVSSHECVLSCTALC